MSLDYFKNHATTREVDTTNSEGFGGYKGVEYKLDKFVYLKLMVYTRWAEPSHHDKFVYGSRRVSRKVFEGKFKTYIRDGKIKV